MKIKRLIGLLVVCLLFLLICCAPTRLVKPLEKGKQLIGLSFGGPLIKFAGAPIPIPFTTLVYGYGLTNKITGFGGIHTTSLLFGNLQTDIGSTIKIFEKENKFGFSATPALQLAYNMRNKTGARLWPSVDLNAYYLIKNDAAFFYCGLATWFEPSNKKAFNEKQTQHILPNIHIGLMLNKSKWMNQFELKYMGLGVANLPGVVDYIGLSGKGTLGIYYSLIRKF